MAQNRYLDIAQKLFGSSFVLMPILASAPLARCLSPGQEDLDVHENQFAAAMHTSANTFAAGVWQVFRQTQYQRCASDGLKAVRMQLSAKIGLDFLHPSHRYHTKIQTRSAIGLETTERAKP
jgi:hypothetical protein